MAQTRAEMIAVLRAVLNRHPEVPPVDLERLRFTENVATEAQDGDAPLSDAILDSCFPRRREPLVRALHVLCNPPKLGPIRRVAALLGLQAAPRARIPDFLP